MTYFIDRRPNAKHKSAVNRQRFLERYRKHIKRSVEEAVNRRSITDMERGEKISIPTKDISEPVFQHGPGGARNIVSPGNKEFLEGDKIRRPAGQGAVMVRARAAPPTKVKVTTSLRLPLAARSFWSSSSMAWSFPIYNASR